MEHCNFVQEYRSLLAFAYLFTENNVAIDRGNRYELEMWANAQRDGRPAEHRWRPLFNAAKFG